MILQFQQIINAFLTYIDSGRIFREPFKWLYMLASFSSALFPIIIIFLAFKHGLFEGPFKIVLAFLLIWIFMLVAGAVGCLIWWDRKDKVSNLTTGEQEFVASPVFAHYIQTAGEVFAIYMAVVGTGISLISGVFLSGDGYELNSVLPFNPSIGFLGVFAFPVLGYLILVFTRFIAEQIKALATIANNTRKTGY